MANYQTWSEVPGMARWSSRTTATDAPTPVLQRVASEASPAAPADAADPTVSDPKAKAKENIERSVHSASMVNQDGHIQLRHLREMLTALNVPADHCEILVTASGAAVKDDHVHFSDFLSWLFPDGEVPQKQRHVRGTGSMLEGLYAGQLSLEDAWCQASFMMQLDELLKVHPYLEPGSTTAAHPLQYWVTRCRAAFTRKKFGEAQESLRRLLAGLRTDQRQISEAFRRFDTDGSGHLDEHECKNMCAYLGWGLEEASLIDLDKDGRITLPDFQGFVGRMGGVQQLFEHRRLRISSSRKDVCDHAGLAVGSRVRAHFYCHGHKSRSWREAQVLAVGVEKRQGPMGPVTYGVLLEFGFGYSEKQKRWRARQVVPPTWVLSSVEDASVQLAMREIGLLDDDQAFWALLLPESEMRAVERLTDCQRKALAGVRAHSTESHEQALAQVKTKFKTMGFEGRELETTLGWIQDMAPVVIHVNLDRMGHFMETDEFYRNQFETKTSNGALDPENNTRKGWERELFGGAYDDAKGFDRCKYGALNVMNDYRGVVKARQYGDSYLVLKDVRLRCTMCSTDSGGMRHNRLGVLDKYAHVLSEYNAKELQGLVEVAMNATAPTDSLAPVPDLLRGSTADPMSDWITVGFPKHSQETGQWFFEVHLREECAAPQVGLLSTSFQSRPGSKTGQGVGDDAHGWAADGLSASRWHGGRNRSWSQVWPAKGGQGNRVLNAGVTVGVAVDLDARKMFFATDGQWDEIPAFGEEDIPLGLALYPAVSLKGKGSFCFGPGCSFAPPSSGFSHWPGLLGQSRIDMPRIGDEEILSLYKEVQIHGEVNLKKHVQRLVAASKYRDVPKTQRSYAVRVTGPAKVAGKYERMGAHAGMPLYQGEQGQKILYDPGSERWRMVLSDEDCPFTAAVQPGVEEPPRVGWEAPDESWGLLPVEIFKAAVSSMRPVPNCSRGHSLKPDKRTGHSCDLCGKSGTDYRCPEGTCDYDFCAPCHAQSLETAKTEAKGITEEELSELLSKLQGQDPVTGASVVFRRRDKADLGTEWPKIAPRLGHAQELWLEGLERLKAKLQEDAGFSMGRVLETNHPYDAKRFSWRKEVNLHGADALEVFFHSRSSTLDQKARFKIFSGGLRRMCAGKFSRVEVVVPGSSDKVWGTVLERDEAAGKWIVHLDTDEVRQSQSEEAAWPAVGEELEAKSNGLWHRATVAEIGEGGTYLVDWFDRDEKDRKKTKKELRKPVERPFDHRSLEDLPRFSTFQGKLCKAICLEQPVTKHVRFGTKSVKFAGDITEAGDEQGVGRMVGDEIAEFALDLSSPLAPLSIASFAGPGPAQEDGVGVGWYLDLCATLGGPSKAQLLKVFDCLGGGESKMSDQAGIIQACFQNLEEVQQRLNSDVRKMRDITLVFTNSCSSNKVNLLPDAHVKFPADISASSEILKYEVLEAKGGGIQDTVSVSTHVHELKKFDNGSTTWYCDHKAPSCSRDSEGPQVRWSCRSCGYDLCRACVEHHMTSPAPRSSGFTIPVKSLAKDGLISGSGVRAGWDVNLQKTLHMNPEAKAQVPEAFETLTRFLHQSVPQLDQDAHLSKAERKKKKKSKKKKKGKVDFGGEEEVTPAEPASEAPAAPSPVFVDRSFSISLEEAMSGPMAMFEVVGKKMEAIMTELGWSDPFEVHSAFPDLTPMEPKVTLASGETAGPEAMMLPLDFSGGDPFGPGGAAEGKESPFPLTFTFKLPVAPGKEAKTEEKDKKEETAPPEETSVDAEEKEEVKEGKEDEEALGEHEGDPPKEAEVKVTIEEAQECIGKLLAVPGICVAFHHPKPQASQVQECFGARGKSCWKHCQVPGDYAEFEFSTDGDGGDKPDRRWGVLALILPAPVEQTAETKVEEFLETWAQTLVRASGTLEQPHVERDAWDEARLRALCARHGWEFEWMTEDGERQRRAREQWDVLKLTTTALPSDPAEPDTGQ